MIDSRFSFDVDMKAFCGDVFHSAVAKTVNAFFFFKGEWIDGEERSKILLHPFLSTMVIVNTEKTEKQRPEDVAG